MTFPTSPSDHPAQLAARALRQVADVLARLEPEQLVALAEGRGQLVFRPVAPDPARAAPARPDPTRPDPTRPAPTRPDPTRAAPARPDPTRPDPTRPAPARPAPARPDPIRPDAARPDPARAARPRPGTGTEPGDLDATVSAIRALGSRAEVADYLSAHDGRLTVPVLKQVARRLGPTVATGRSKAELKRNIIEGTAGFRERSMAMSRGAWS